MITIVGLGITEGDLTKAGERAILSAKKVLVRTAFNRSYQSVLSLGVAHDVLDEEYEGCRNFSALHKRLANRVKEAEREYGEVVYCVDGAASEDNSVKVLLKKRGEKKIINGVSKIEYFAAKGNFSSCSYTAVSAYEAEEAEKRGKLVAPLIVYDLDDCAVASDVKLLLSDRFGEEKKVLFLSGEKTKKIPLYELDRQKEYEYLTAVCIEEEPLLEKTRFTFDDLHEIIRRLRRPDGCPWDRVQTPDSVKMSAVEESYELLDAILSGDPDKILEETGDVLMQAVFHAVMQEERGNFNLSDVLQGICEKLITRHTHVFGKDKAGDENEALSVWDKNKMTEKHQQTYADAVNDVPKCYPALLQAQKIVKRLEKGGWTSDYQEIKAELLENLTVLEQTLSQKDVSKKKDALGNLLFTIARLCRATGADGEEALLERLDTVKRRYERYETAVLADGKDVNALSETEKEEYYRRTKDGNA